MPRAGPWRAASWRVGSFAGARGAGPGGRPRGTSSGGRHRHRRPSRPNSTAAPPCGVAADRHGRHRCAGRAFGGVPQRTRLEGPAPRRQPCLVGSRGSRALSGAGVVGCGHLCNVRSAARWPRTPMTSRGSIDGTRRIAQAARLSAASRKRAIGAFPPRTGGGPGKLRRWPGARPGRRRRPAMPRCPSSGGPRRGHILHRNSACRSR